MTTAASWIVGAERQAAFVALSGDLNPLHTDPIVARRLPFGRIAVHGVHLLLDTLERAAGPIRSAGQVPHRIQCTFRHPVGIDDTITTTIDATDAEQVHATVTVDVWVAADIQIELSGPPTTPPPGTTIAPVSSLATIPETHTIADLADHSGSTAVTADMAIAGRMFPRLLDLLGPGPFAELVSLTRIVGMHTPGLRSLFSGLDVTFEYPIGRPTETIDYAVTTTDDRFSRVVIDVAGPTLHGNLTTFVRAEPVEQMLGDTRPRSDEFAGQRWLVIGGSRGLGAATVQLLAAGDADVRFTYRTGSDDASEVERTTGARSYRLDVLDVGPALGELTCGGWQPTHLAYMASPPIFDGIGGVYSEALFQRFRSMYVDAFTRLVDELGPGRLRGLLWPSSEALDHDVAGMAEYADAKRAGERACRDLDAAHPALTVHTPRLPRLLTDQSTSFVPTQYGDTPGEMLAALRGVSG